MPVTIEDLSQKLGLSRSTVSKALNARYDVAAATRERVVQAANELGYQPSAAARNLRRQRTDKIGLVVNYPIHQVSDFLAELIPGMATAAEAAAYNLILYTSMAGNAQRIKSLCRSREVDGIIVAWPPQLDETLQLSQLMRDEQMPHILLPRYVPSHEVSFVAADHEQGARLLTEHLIALGHRRIGFTRRLEVFETDEKRFDGYRRALTDAGIGHEHELVFNSRSDDPDDAARILDALIGMDHPPTAMLFFTDPMAIQVLSLAKQRGIRIPGELSIAGFDGILSSGITEPALTTVRQPMQRMGALAAESLLELIANGSERPIQHTMPVQLIARASTGRAPKVNGKGGSRLLKARLFAM